LNTVRVPIIQGYDYVAVVLKNVKVSSVMVPRESAGFPTGTIAIVPLLSEFDNGNAFFQSQTSKEMHDSWRIETPQGLQQLNELHFQILTHGGFVKGATTKTEPDKLIPSSIPDPSKHTDTSFTPVNIAAKWIPDVIPYPLAPEPDISLAPSTLNNVYIELVVTNDM
jgi:hypothetical protein